MAHSSEIWGIFSNQCVPSKYTSKFTKFLENDETLARNEKNLHGFSISYYYNNMAIFEAFAKYISSSIKIIFMKSGWKQTLLGHYWAAAAKSCTKTCKISPAVIIFCDNIVVWSCIFSHINDLKLTDSAHLCS